MKVLLVEDDPGLQSLHSELMRIWGYDYDLASSGTEAVEYVANNQGRYDLCLMDIDLPEMNGIEATRRIRASHATFPIIALTGLGKYKNDCLDAGMEMFIAKPCAPTRLHQLINLLCAGRA